MNLTNQITSLAQNAIQNNLCSSITIHIQKNNQTPFIYTATHKKHAHITNPIYDLASLTKPIATTTLMMLAYQQQKISINTPLSIISPDIPAKHYLANYTITNLLQHQTPLPAWHDFTSITQPTAENILTHLLSIPPRLKNNQPDHTQTYSDLGFILLGLILEKTYNLPLNTLFDNFTKIANIDELTFLPLLTLPKNQIIPTKYIDQSPLIGLTDDDNCRAIGGVAGHAGLFASATAIAKYAQLLLNPPSHSHDLPTKDTINTFLNPPLNNGHFALGWELPSGNNSLSARPHLEPHTRGHLGYTGTSIWINTLSKSHIILLTNRQHTNNQPQSIKQLRIKLHTLAWQLIDSTPN